MKRKQKTGNWLGALDRKELARLVGPIGMQIKHIRRARGWTQEKLARKVRLARSSIANIENGHRRPSPTNQNKIFKVLWVNDP